MGILCRPVDGHQEVADEIRRHLYVSTDGLAWRQTKFPHSAMP